MRVARLIAALTLFAGLAGCWYPYPEPISYWGTEIPHQGTPLTRCGTCEDHAAVLPPAPYNDTLR